MVVRAVLAVLGYVTPVVVAHPHCDREFEAELRELLVGEVAFDGSGIARL
jgi:hypothetical protein